MYFPYLRGRQFELLALRELLEKNLVNEKVVPIIEPIKPTPTLIRTIKTYIDSETEISIIMNPQVGEFVNNIEQIKSTNKNESIRKPLLEYLMNEKVIKAYIMSNKISARLQEDTQKENLIIVNKNRDCIVPYSEVYSECTPKFSLIPDDRTFRRFVESGKILFEDRFNKKNRNVDYIDNDDEFFSDDHIYYKEEGYEGFSDYSIVGKEFNESGFAPLAVAIHIVYFDNNFNLRIKHFVSDSNEDISDPAGKFSEALEKLVDWSYTRADMETEALRQFRTYYETQKYPGLGTVKKLSIMHHIELISKYLEGNR